MNDAMTDGRTVTSPTHPSDPIPPALTATPPPLSTTAFVVSGGHLAWLGWVWAVTAAIFAVVIALVVRFGELDSSLWQDAGASWQRFVIFAAGVTTLPSFLAVFVGHGVTRAQLSASNTVSMVLVAAAGTVFVIAGFIAEAVVFGGAGWDHVLDGGGPVASAAELAVLALRYAVLFCMWFSAGWLIGTGFYRYGFIGGVALVVPFAIPVLLCELVVGQAGASISIGVLNDLVSTPAAVGLLVGVGLIAMNATVARAFTRGAAVHTC